MNRRNFLFGLFALPAAVKALAFKPKTDLCATEVDCISKGLMPHPCSLTHASIQPLTPADMEALAEKERQWTDIDEVFRKFYAVENRGKPAEMIFRGGEEEYQQMCAMFKKAARR